MLCAACAAVHPSDLPLASVPVTPVFYTYVLSPLHREQINREFVDLTVLFVREIFEVVIFQPVLLLRTHSDCCDKILG